MSEDRDLANHVDFVSTGGLTRHQQQKKPPETGPPWHDRHLWWLIKNHGH